MIHDPDLHRRLYTIAQIARSYQGSHVSVANMPSDDEFLYALKNNGHHEAKLAELKAEYTKQALLVWGK